MNLAFFFGYISGYSANGVRRPSDPSLYQSLWQRNHETPVADEYFPFQINFHDFISFLLLYYYDRLYAD